MLVSFLMFILLFTGLFLIVLVLIQRGKGGGLAGAFGGLGGQSAFGTKAGDMFTKITIGVAAFWILLCMVMVKIGGGGTSALSESLGSAADQRPAANAPASPGEKQSDNPGTLPAAPKQQPANDKK